MFLKQLDDLLTSEGVEVLLGRIKRFKHACGRFSYFINYSDDLLGFSPTIDCMKEIETIINKKFRVKLESGVPPKWVGMDLCMKEGAVYVSSASTFIAYDVERTKFTLKSLDELSLKEKSDDEKAKKKALSVVGKLLYGATFNPWLTFLSSFLAAALHYDPVQVSAIASAAIYYYAQKPPTIAFLPIKPSHLVLYCDASHSLKSGRAHAGSWLQLQTTGEPAPRGNPVSWGSQK